MSGERARRRRWRRRIWWLVATLLIGSACVVGAFSLMFPWLLAHPERVAQFLSDRLQQPVRFDRLDGEWLAVGPRFRLSGLEIGAAGDATTPPLRLDHAELALDFYAPFKRGVSWHELRVIGLSIDLERSRDGQLRVIQWGGTAQEAGDPFASLQRLGSFRLAGAAIRLHDLGSDSRVELSDINVRIGPDPTGRQRIEGDTRVGGVGFLGLRCDLGRDFQSGQCYGRTRELPLGQALGALRVQGVSVHGGSADLDAWLSFSERKLSHIRIELAAETLALRGLRGVVLGNGDRIEPRYSPDHTRLAIDWRRVAGGERIGLVEADDLDREDAARSRLSWQRSEAGDWQLDVEQIVLDRLAPWFSLTDRIPESLAGWIFEAAPQGRLKAVRIHGQAADIHAIEGRLERLSLNATRRSPRFSPIDLSFFGDAEAMQAQISPAEVVVDFPGVFAAPLPLSIEKTEFVLARDAETKELLLEVPALALQGNEFGLDGWLALRFQAEGRRPFIQGAFAVRDSAVLAAKAFWPINIMPRTTQNWLNRGLLDGRIRSGLAAIHGDLDDWPFRGSEGRFVAEAQVDDLQLLYHPDWPTGRVGSTTVHFVNSGLSAEASDASIRDTHIDRVFATIPDFKRAILALEGRGGGSGQALLDFARNTPLNNRYRDQLLALNIGGEGDVSFQLHLPLKAEFGAPALNGRLDLRQADLADAKLGLRFDQASGTVRFSREGFAADRLNVRVDGDVAELSIAVGAFTADPAHRVEASLIGEMKASSALSAFHAFDPYWNRVPGKADFDLSLTVPTTEGARSQLLVNSDLAGIALNFPAPFSKDSESALPLRIDMDLPVGGTELQAQLGGIARFAARLPNEGESIDAHLALGGELAEVPALGAGLLISGNAPSIDLGGWSTIGSPGSGVRLPLAVDVDTAELDFLGRSFANTRVQLTRLPDHLRADLKGEGIDGSFDIPTENLATRGLTLQFETLHWPEARLSPGSATPTDPSRLPPLHIWIRDLKMGKAVFGEARVETQPMAAGMRIEQFDARSPTLTMRATGSWLLEQGAERSDIDLTLSSESLGKMLESFGFSGFVDGGQTVAHIRGGWAGSPALFALDRINGELAGEVGQGRILNVDPGAGRIFGLVNFGAIPRRLSLDFRDFFQSGMAFDSIRGSFTLSDGSAHTSDLLIQGPAADIRINGRTGLRAKDYEQEMEVTPKLRGALPIVGAVAGGPVGAVVGVLAQEVMRKPIDEVVSTRYRVSGSWEKPDIALIGKSARRVAPVAEVGEGAGSG